MVGCVASILLASTAVPIIDDYDPDTVAFPAIDTEPPTIEYLFPDILEASGGHVSQDGRTELVSVEEEESIDESERADTVIDSFLLQAGSFEQQQHADVFRASLILRGYNAKTTRVEVPEIGTRYRVVVGPYASQQEAIAVTSRLKAVDVDAVLLGIRD